MRDEIEPPRKVDPPTRTAVRRRRLHRGAARFHRDVLNDGRRLTHVFIFGLTVRSPEIALADGEMRHLMKQLRDTHPGVRYIWWLEYQRRGAAHYHGQIEHPAFVYGRELKTWLGEHWPHADIQPHAERKSFAWFRDRGADYAMKDVNKGCRKGHQQVYEDTPPRQRTFSTHRLACSADEHAQHEDKAVVELKPVEADQLGSRLFAPHVVLIRRHVPARGGCQLRPRRARARSPSAARFRH